MSEYMHNSILLLGIRFVPCFGEVPSNLAAIMEKRITNFYTEI